MPALAFVVRFWFLGAFIASRLLDKERCCGGPTKRVCNFGLLSKPELVIARDKENVSPLVKEQLQRGFDDFYVV